MSKAARRRLRIAYNEFDDTQSKFGKDGKAIAHKEQKTEIEFAFDMNMQVLCPFCLYKYKLQAFLVSTKKGISQKRAKCPECGNGMLMSSLTADMTPEQYAEWCFEYSPMGFWQKVKFSKWSDRLYKIGWARRFWEKYKELKADAGIESYSDHMEQKAREWAVDEGYLSQ